MEFKLNPTGRHQRRPHVPLAYSRMEPPVAASMNESSELHERGAMVRKATRFGMLAGAGVALLWVGYVLRFARHPMETDELGLYQLFALTECAVCLVVFVVMVAIGAVVGRISGAIVVGFRRRASRPEQGSHPARSATNTPQPPPERLPAATDDRNAKG